MTIRITPGQRDLILKRKAVADAAMSAFDQAKNVANAAHEALVDVLIGHATDNDLPTKQLRYDVKGLLDGGLDLELAPEEAPK